MNESFHIGGEIVKPGERKHLEIPLASGFAQPKITIPVQVVNGHRPGPRLFVSAAVHGDEINGIEIIRRLMRMKLLKKVKGTLVVIPVVNVLGFYYSSRYLPDRRDLNRLFPGSENGSLGSQLAHIFMEEVVSNCTHGIDLHTAAVHRDNLPQIRAQLDIPENKELAKAFGAPVIMNAILRDGSLREAVAGKNIPMLLYEAGEALRFNEVAIKTGLLGIISVMRAINMLPPLKNKRKVPNSVIANSSHWERASVGGILITKSKLGNYVHKNQEIGSLVDAYGKEETPVHASSSGIIIGKTNIPLVYQGDAIFHIAKFSEKEEIVDTMETFRSEMDDLEIERDSFYE